MYARIKSILFRLNTDREHCSWSYCLCVMLSLAKEKAAPSSQRLNDLSKLIPSLFKALWWNDFFHIFLYFLFVLFFIQLGSCSSESFYPVSFMISASVSESSCAESMWLDVRIHFCFLFIHFVNKNVHRTCPKI